jgi:hypothetical protein
MTDGQLLPRLYERMDGSHLFVRELFPEPRTITIPMTKVKGVYAVRLRGD